MIELYNAGLSAIISQYQQFVNKTSSLVKFSYLVPIYPTTRVTATTPAENELGQAKPEFVLYYGQHE